MARHQIRELYLSVTQHCNLTCTYCSADAGPDRHIALSVQSALDSLREWIGTAAPDRLSLIFSGGEPTLWGYDSLDRICGEASELATAAGKQVTIGIQSNGTTIGARFIRWCRDWRIEPSFSLDGMPHLNNRLRGSGETVVEGLHRLRDEGICFAVISCLTREVAADIDAILDWYRENGFLKVRINTLGYTPPGRVVSSYPGSEDIHHARRRIYAHMQSHGASGVCEKNVAEAVAIFDAIWLGTAWAKRHCADLECGAGRQVAAVNPDGRWVPCIEKSMTDGLPPTNSLAELSAVSDALWAGFKGWDICRGCAAAPICDHGCPVYHKLNHSRFTHECAANKMFWSFLAQERLAALLTSASGVQHG